MLERAAIAMRFLSVRRRASLWRIAHTRLTIRLFHDAAPVAVDQVLESCGNAPIVIMLPIAPGFDYARIAKQRQVVTYRGLTLVKV